MDIVLRLKRTGEVSFSPQGSAASSRRTLVEALSGPRGGVASLRLWYKRAGIRGVARNAINSFEFFLGFLPVVLIVFFLVGRLGGRPANSTS
jgi:hypothetical protein